MVPIDTKPERVRSSPGQPRTKKTVGGKSNGTIKGRCNLENSSSSNHAQQQQPSASSHLNGPSTLGGHHENNSLSKLEAAVDSGSRDSRGTSIDRFSDISRHSNSSRGYLVSALYICDFQSTFQLIFFSISSISVIVKVRTMKRRIINRISDVIAHPAVITVR